MFLEPFPLFLQLFEHLVWYPPSYHFSSLSSLFAANYTFPVSGGFFVLLSSFLLPLPLLCLFSRSFSPQLLCSLPPLPPPPVSSVLPTPVFQRRSSQSAGCSFVLDLTMWLPGSYRGTWFFQAPWNGPAKPYSMAQETANSCHSLQECVCVCACVWAWFRASVSVQYDRWLPVCAWAFFWWDLSLFVVWQGRKPPISLFSCECMCVCVCLSWSSQSV